MAGYSDFSKSNNAVAAEDRGLLVASKLAKHAARRWPRLRGITAADIEDVMTAAEWHHTSKMYNRVNYYDPSDLRVRGVRGKLYRRALERRAAKKLPVVTLTGCTVKWLEWGGTRRHPVSHECAATNATCEFRRGKTMVLVRWTDDGGTPCELKKHLTTRGFTIHAADGHQIFDNRADKDSQ